MNGTKKLPIDPWGAIKIKNYEKIFKDFGLTPFPNELKMNLEHLVFRRGIVIAHRDFDKVYEKIKNKQPFINMTGIATSSYLHLGHKLVVDIFKFFKEKSAVNLFGICDIDAYVSRSDNKVPSLEKSKEFAIDNLANVLALGLSKKDIYIQSKKEQRYYEFAFELSKKITTSTFEAIYGHLDLGKVSANLLQYADILHGQLKEYFGPMPSITAIAVEQDPHIRATRDLARRLPYNFVLPSSIYIEHLPSLKGINEKMSSSIPESAIFLNDDPELAAKKIMNAFTGQQPTAELQKKLGGNPEICTVCQYYKFLFEGSDKKVREICFHITSFQKLGNKDLPPAKISYYLHIFSIKILCCCSSEVTYLGWMTA